MLVRRFVRRSTLQRTKHRIAEEKKRPYGWKNLRAGNIIAAARVPNGEATVPCSLGDGPVAVRATSGCVRLHQAASSKFEILLLLGGENCRNSDDFLNWE